jgi:hypothetical protein
MKLCGLASGISPVRACAISIASVRHLKQAKTAINHSSFSDFQTTSHLQLSQRRFTFFHPVRFYRSIVRSRRVPGKVVFRMRTLRSPATSKGTAEQKQHELLAEFANVD